MMKTQKSVWFYIKRYKFKSLSVQNFIYIFTFVSIPLLLVLSFSYRKISQEANDRMADMNEEILKKNAVVTDNIMAEVLNVLDTMAKCDAIKGVVQIQETDEGYYASVQKAIAAFQESTVSNSFISAVCLYSDMNQQIIHCGGIHDVGITDSKDKWYYIYKNIPMNEPYIIVDTFGKFFFCQPVTSNLGEAAGILVLEVEIQKIRDMLENEKVSQLGMFFLMDYSGQIIYCSELDYSTQEETFRNEYRNVIAQVGLESSVLTHQTEGRIISAMDSTYHCWRHVLVTETSGYVEEMQLIRGFLLSSIVVGLCTSILASFIITFITYRPVRKIVDVIREPQLHWNDEGDRESRELIYVTSNILNTLSQKEQMSQELEERVRMLRLTQFRALQFQIDPHFLYNTLETIKWSAVEELGLGNKVSRMITRMAQFYRAGLENNDMIISLKQEIEFLKLYIEIIGIRFGENITFHWDIDEELLECSVVKMSLQMLVENAINHGLRPKSYCGNITISVYREEEKLFIAVRNDGEGMSENEICRMNERLRTGCGFEENKVGLRNVNERVKLIYGKEYGVHLECTRKQETPDQDAVISMSTIIVFPYSS